MVIDLATPQESKPTKQKGPYDHVQVTKKKNSSKSTSSSKPKFLKDLFKISSSSCSSPFRLFRHFHNVENCCWCCTLSRPLFSCRVSCCQSALKSALVVAEASPLFSRALPVFVGARIGIPTRDQRALLYDLVGTLRETKVFGFWGKYGCKAIPSSAEESAQRVNATSQYNDGVSSSFSKWPNEIFLAPCARNGPGYC